MFSWGVPGFLGSVPRFLGKFRAFLGVFLVFLGVFWVFLGCSGFSWECFGFFGSVPVFSVVPECSVMFQCSGVPGSTTCRILLSVQYGNFGSVDRDETFIKKHNQTDGT